MTRWWIIFKGWYNSFKVYGLPNILMHGTCICRYVGCLHSYGKDYNTVYTDNGAISQRPQCKMLFWLPALFPDKRIKFDFGQDNGINLNICAKIKDPREVYMFILAQILNLITISQPKLHFILLSWKSTGSQNIRGSPWQPVCIFDQN